MIVLNSIGWIQDNLDTEIAKCVDDLWAKYEKDENGNLDKQKTKAFVEEILPKISGAKEFSDEDFETCSIKFFKFFKNDGSGTIDKDDMSSLIKKVTGITNMYGK